MKNKHRKKIAKVAFMFITLIISFSSLILIQIKVKDSAENAEAKEIINVDNSEENVLEEEITYYNQTLLGNMYTKNESNRGIFNQNIYSFEFKDLIKLYPYYKEANNERYIALSNMGTLPNDVVWKVNMNLDKPFYADITKIENPEQDILVTKYRALSENYVPQGLVKLDNIIVRNDVKSALTSMMDALKNEGAGSIELISGYRDYNYQKSLYEEYSKMEKNTGNDVNTYSAKPGHSEHQTGRAIDIAAKGSTMELFGSTNQYQWILNNGYKYGFIIRYKANVEDITGYQFEPWHITFVGVETATNMYQNNVQTLEEYIAKK